MTISGSRHLGMIVTLVTIIRLTPVYYCNYRQTPMAKTLKGPTKTVQAVKVLELSELNYIQTLSAGTTKSV